MCGLGGFVVFLFFFFKQKTAYEMRISDWSSDVCSSDLQDAVMLQRRIELGQGAAPVRLVEKMGERVAEADDRVVLALDVPVQPAPVGLGQLEDQVAALAVLEGLGQHRRISVDAGDVEARQIGRAHV